MRFAKQRRRRARGLWAAKRSSQKRDLDKYRRLKNDASGADLVRRRPRQARQATCLPLLSPFCSTSTASATLRIATDSAVFVNANPRSRDDLFRPLAEVRATRKLPSKPLEADVQSTQSSSVADWPAVQPMPGEDSGLNAVGGSAMLLRVCLHGPVVLLSRLRSVGATIHVCSSPGFRRRVSDGSSPKQSL